MSERFSSFPESDYSRRREAMIAWAVYRFGIDRGEATDHVDEANCRWLARYPEAPLPPAAWWRKVVRNLFLDENDPQRNHEVEMPTDPESGETLEDQLSTEQANGTTEQTEISIAANEVEKRLPLFLKDFRQNCSSIQRRIADFVCREGEFFEHDGTLGEFSQSMHALLKHNCKEMGIGKPRKVLAERIKQEFGLSQTYFDQLMNSMRGHWCAAREVFDPPRQLRDPDESRI